MPRRAPVHGRRRITTKRHSTQRQDKERKNSGQRGYDAQWRKLRLAKLRADPLCECDDCQAGERRLTPADVVDHIEPISDRPDLRLSWDNLRSMAKRCHDRHTARTQAFGRSVYGSAHPDWLPVPGIPVTVVTGPPASGKTTYAHAHAGIRDEVLDLDAIACRLSGHSGHDWPRSWLGLALRERNSRIADWSRTRRGRGWLIVSAPTLTERDWWREKLAAEIVVIEADANTCAERARQDGRLTDRLRYLIASWIERYERTGRDIIVRGGAGSVSTPCDQ